MEFQHFDQKPIHFKSKTNRRAKIKLETKREEVTAAPHLVMKQQS